MEEIADCRGKYDFMIALFALRFLLEIPIVLIRTKVESKGGRNKPKEYSLKYWYPCKSDAKLSKRDFLMFASNGFDVVVPCLPTPIAELKKTTDTFKDTIKEGIELCAKILEMTPNCFQISLQNNRKFTSDSIDLVPRYSPHNWGSRSDMHWFPTCCNACG